MVQMVEIWQICWLEMCLQRFWFKASVPSFVPTEHDSGWTPVLIRTRGLSVKTMNKETAPLVSPSVFYLFPLNSFMLICCSFNSFSIFGHYISARLQIIWRPYLWLVWSFTQMVSFLEFSIPNPVFPPAFFLLFPSTFWMPLPPASFS